MDLQGQMRQFKDFLQLYNVITEHCFKHCVSSVLTRDVEDEENSCILNCVDKYANTNQAIMKTYIEVQNVINEKRMAEYNENAQLLQQQQEQQLKEQELATNVSETPT